MMMSDLEEILDGTDEEESEVTETEATEETEASAETVDEVVEETEGTEVQATGETDVSPASQDEENAAAIAGLQAELGRIRQQNRQLKEQATPPEPKPDFFADPDLALNQLQNTVKSEVQRARIDMSEQLTRKEHEDFDDKIATFQVMANDNPALWAEMGGQINPAEWAYDQATTKIEMAEIGDIGSFKDKIRAEAKAEARKEFEKENEAKIEAEIRKRSGLPRSLSDARNVSDKDIDTSDQGLDSIVGEDISHR